MPDLTLVVLAAGIGSRYGGLKQIEPVGPHGEILVEYSVFDALRAGFERVVFVIKEELAELFHERLGRKVERHCDLAYVFQRLEDLPPGYEVPAGRHKPWGTAHAVLCCRKAVTSPFAVVNADDFYGRAAYQALAGFLQRRSPAPASRLARQSSGVKSRTSRRGRDRRLPAEAERDYCLVGYRLLDTLSPYGPVARGICSTDGAGRLLEIHERTRIEPWDGAARYTEDGIHWIPLPPDTLVSMNIWGFTPGLFSDLEALFALFLERNGDALATAEFYLPVAVGELVRAGRACVQVLPAEGRWFGITYQADKAAVERAILDLHRQGVYPDPLWADP